MHKRLSLHVTCSALALTMALAGSALAAEGPTYLLQLGTFNSRNDAEKRWSTLSGQYGALLGNLHVRYQEVTLPPDNLKVYRTQAGPLATKQEAQKSCSQLSAKGEECLVIETAMYRAGESVATTPAPVSNAPAAPAASPFDVVDAAPQVAQQAATVAARAAAGKGLKPLAAANAAADISSASGSLGTVAAGVAASQVLANEAPAEAVSSNVQNSFLSTAPEVPSADVSVPTEAAAAANTLATELASSGPALTTEEVKAPAPAVVPSAPEKQSSFWSFLPWSGGDDQIEKLPETEVVREEPTHVAAPTPEPSAPVRESKGLLLPPPPEASDAAIAEVRAMKEQAANNPVVPTPSVPDASPKTLMTEPPSTVLEGLQSGDLPWKGGDADVKVSEAVRVPLSQDEQPEAQPQKPSASMGTPSQTMTGRTLWAQINYFDSQQAALSHWDGFRKAHPNFPAMRVRVTKPYKVDSAEPKISLRVGPFAEGDQLKAFCSEAVLPGLECSTISDYGSATAQRQTGNSVGTAEERYYAKQGPATLNGKVMQWVQLGAFNTPADADSAWQTIKANYADALGDTGYAVSAPVLGSHAKPVYRLRAGPFVSNIKAMELCNKLRDRNVPCMIVDAK